MCELKGWMHESSFNAGCGEQVHMYKAIAHIRKNETGEVIQSPTSVWMDEDGTPNVFNWEENNFSCDCNRELFFHIAKGEEDPDNPCGHHRFSVNLSNPVDGKVFYREYD